MPSPMHPQCCDAALPHGPEPQSAFECDHFLEPKQSSPEPPFAPAGLVCALFQFNPGQSKRLSMSFPAASQTKIGEAPRSEMPVNIEQVCVSNSFAAVGG